jgi:hypothetical protein
MGRKPPTGHVFGRRILKSLNQTRCPEARIKYERRADIKSQKLHDCRESFGYCAMNIEVDHILSILDRCCDAFTFPMLDNGYVYLAATRLSLYRFAMDWAIEVEIFGFSPRSALPDTNIYTLASRLHDRDRPEQYVNCEAYNNYLINNPHNESRFVFPLDEWEWQDAEDSEIVAEGASEIVVRMVRTFTINTELVIRSSRIAIYDWAIAGEGIAIPALRVGWNRPRILRIDAGESSLDVRVVSRLSEIEPSFTVSLIRIELFSLSVLLSGCSISMTSRPIPDACE